MGPGPNLLNRFSCTAHKWLAVSLAGALLLGCAGDAPRGTTVIAKVPERLVIVPLNITFPMPAELQGSSGLVWNALEVYLRSHNVALQTLSADTARRLWLASIQKAQSDPQNKKPDFDDAARIFVVELTSSAQFDAVLFPSLYVQRATLSGTTARWDDTEQTIEVDVGGRDAVFPEDVEGAAPAASLHVAVVDAERREAAGGARRSRVARQRADHASRRCPGRANALVRAAPRPVRGSHGAHARRSRERSPRSCRSRPTTRSASSPRGSEPPRRRRRLPRPPPSRGGA